MQNCLVTSTISKIEIYADWNPQLQFAVLSIRPGVGQYIHVCEITAYSIYISCDPQDMMHWSTVCLFHLDPTGFDGSLNTAHFNFYKQAHSFIFFHPPGTEAAAATAAIISMNCLPPRIQLDHPFLFTIIDNRTKAVLFMGRFQKPNWLMNFIMIEKLYHMQ